EIAAALRSSSLVIPVLVDGAQMPTRQRLPEDLWPLTRRHALIFQRTGRTAIQKILTAIERVEDERQRTADGSTVRQERPVSAGQSKVEQERPVSAGQSKAKQERPAKVGQPSAKHAALEPSVALISFAAEPPQAPLPYGRWAETLAQHFLSACGRI